MKNRCKRCRQEIRWVRFKKTGKMGPVDPIPDANGNIVVDELGFARVIKIEEAVVHGSKYIIHMATCPKERKNRGKETRSNSRDDAV